MTAACRNPGTIATAICSGCNLSGFAAHACTGEAIEIAASTGHKRLPSYA